MPNSTVTNTITATQALVYAPTSTNLVGRFNGNHTYSKELASGTSANQVNTAPEPTTLTFTGTTPQSIDVRDSLQIAGETPAVTCKLRSLLITNTSGTGTLTLSGNLATLLGISGAVVEPGGALLWSAPAVGLTMVASSSDTLTLTPSASCVAKVSFSGINLDV